MQWASGGLYEAGREEKLPINIPGLDLRVIDPGQTLSDMLLDGDLDAIMGPRPPRGFPGPRVRRLFPNFKEIEQEYFRRTRVFPIMHTVVIRRDLLDREPWVARSLYDAFCEAKARATAQLSESVVLAVTLPWLIAEVESTQAVMGEDYWPYGVERNRAALDTLIRYSCEQGLAQRSLPIEELFAASTLDGYRI
jgi:4,5-dihydroxyphthalate decarboxylase